MKIITDEVYIALAEELRCNIADYIAPYVSALYCSTEGLDTYCYNLLVKICRYNDIAVIKLEHFELTIYMNDAYVDNDFDFERIKSLVYMKKGKSFSNDLAKMNDFRYLTKEEFIKSYSYLSELDYLATQTEQNYN